MDPIKNPFSSGAPLQEQTRVCVASGRRGRTFLRTCPLAKLEDPKPGCAVRGVRHGESVDVIELTFRSEAGKPDSELLFRNREPQLKMVEAGRRLSYEADGGSSDLCRRAAASSWRTCSIQNPKVLVGRF
jgi:hypothetical protein